MDCKKNFDSLVCCSVGQPYKIKKIQNTLETKYRLRLLELGFLPNEEIFVKQKSLKKKTFLVEVRGNMFVLQENIARFVEVGKV
ncbi:MAG: ferrous iron transport protein A [Clostridia bacterium]|nr:ferrous iron transport protein A [Clostridia bacterium]